MQSALERRQQIKEYLSDMRTTTLAELTTEFGCSMSTIRRDLDILTESVPILTQQGGNGGIRVADGWYADRRYLNQAQEALLKALYPGLQPEQQKVMESILAAFAKPKI